MGTGKVVVVMGVSGTGKTTVGGLLAEALGVPYAEADDFHPPANIAKMRSGTPLDDRDREPWLDAVGAWAAGRVGLGGVVSCSALKRAYRDRLRAAAPGLFFVHLAGEPALIAERLAQRRGHFMPSGLLDSQFAALEPLQADEYGVTVPVTEAPEAVVTRASAALAVQPSARAAGRAVSASRTAPPGRRAARPGTRWRPPGGGR